MKKWLPISACLLFLIFSLFAQKPAGALKFLQKKGVAIHLSDTLDFADLKKLGKIVRHKRMVLLGESTHGAREMGLIKNRIIQYLHQEHGFTVLLFESGIGEIFGMAQQRRKLPPKQLAQAGLMGPWLSAEYNSLMEYLKNHPDLAVGGFDVQRTGGSFMEVLQAFDVILRSSGQIGLEFVEEQFSELRSKLLNRQTKADEALERQQAETIRQLEAAQKAVDDFREVLLTAGWEKKETDLVLHSLQNRIDFIRYFYQFKLDNDYVKRFTARDSVMAANVLWLAENYFPQEKIIITAHNHHISRYNERDFVMGEKLAEVYGEEMYSIGLFPGKGSYANNSRKEEKIENSGAEDDLQNIIGHHPADLTFIAIPSRPKKGSDWLFQPITINNTFINLWGDKQMNLSESFDGLIFIREISPAEY